MQNYNFIQKVLHDLLLSNNFLKKSLFEIEKIFFLNKNTNQIKTQKHVFITGLPRSGTTAILNFLYSTNYFSSLTYKNMPFVMALNLFSKFQKKTSIKKKERLHKDGIYFDLNSPEAFDEIFFSSFKDNELKYELIYFINLILLNKITKRYLSKNNLNYKRIDLILSILPNSIFLIPFREPLQHSFSLFKQHEHFTSIQTKNNFIKRYMNYLGHNEFGNNHKSWNTPKLYNNYLDLNYWLEQWLMFYSDIYHKYKNYKNCYFVRYESLQNSDYLDNLTNILELKKITNHQFKLSKKEIANNVDKNLHSSALNLYRQINYNLYY